MKNYTGAKAPPGDEAGHFRPPPPNKKKDKQKLVLAAAVILGRFEYSLLQAVEILGTDAYGAQIGRYLSDKLHRDVTAPQVYMTLERLAKRGLVRSETTEPVHARGGRSRRRFLIEADGARALRHTTAVLHAIPNSNEVRDDDQVECPA
jgi:PadR family transcriptional regulator, regulatory protein PadR